MPPITAYCDECVDFHIVALLRERGYLVRTVKAEGTDAATDDDQFRYADLNGWLLLTHNERHFRRWDAIFRQNQWPHNGIATIPYSLLMPRLVVRFAIMLDWIAAKHSHTQDRLFRCT